MRGIKGIENRSIGNGVDLNSLARPLGMGRNESMVFSLPYSVDFSTLPDGPLPSRFTGSTWAVVGGKAINAPLLGNEMVTDGGLENWISATNLTSWSESLTGTSTINQETSIVHGESSALRLDIDASNSNSNVSQSLPGMLAGWVLVDWWGRSSVSGKQLSVSLSSSSKGVNRDPGTAWTHYKDWLLRPSAAGNIFLQRGTSSASSSLYHDDASAKNGSGLVAVLPKANTPNLKVKVSGTITPGIPIGGAIYLDGSQTSGVVFAHNGVNAILSQKLNGTYTILIDTVATLGNGIELRKAGTTVKIYCNDIQISTDKTLDASLTDADIPAILGFGAESGITQVDILPN
jgi:hypothetical protein